MEEQTKNIIFHHQTPAQLRFSDVDRFGHVNNSVYFSLFDMSKEKYFMDVVDGDMFHKVNIVVANINASFLAPIYFPCQQSYARGKMRMLHGNGMRQS